MMIQCNAGMLIKASFIHWVLMGAPAACEDRTCYRALLQQAKETGRLQQVESLRKTDPDQFNLLVLEFRSKCPAYTDALLIRYVLRAQVTSQHITSHCTCDLSG